MASLLCLQASAESLRCSGGSAVEGDSRAAVTFKCGPPLIQDSYCAPVLVVEHLFDRQRTTDHHIARSAACVRIDEWIYERGPGNLPATVKFQSGVLRSIEYGRSPR